jgi:hypothetical protein
MVFFPILTGLFTKISLRFQNDTVNSDDHLLVNERLIPQREQYVIIPDLLV